ncbi:MAG TPA: Clp protease N-terminal domain-containing protein [Streptosporangiaceae bacterium]|nr:Clp protease N-terminal domain-containing protein [Streptosporangiaceae bacterium]
MFERLTDRARAAVIRARGTAAERGDQIRPVYLLHAVALGEGTAARALAGLGIDAGTIERQLDRAAPRGRPLECDLDSADAEALASIGIDLDEIRRRVEESFGPGALGRGPAPQGPAGRAGRMTMTGEAKQSMVLAIKEARALHHTYLGDEHLLLGLLEAAQLSPRGDFTLDTLRDLGIDPVQARQRVLDELRHASDLT